MQNIKYSQFQTMRNIYSQEEFGNVAKLSLISMGKNNENRKLIKIAWKAL